MTNVTVQEALNNTLVILDALTVEFGITGLEPLIAECKAALSKIEKCEPVAYMYEYPSKVEGWTTRTLSVSLEPDLHHLVKVTPLFTSPQPRDWVGLNYHEILECLPDDAKRVPEGWHVFADAISEKLKQLNTKG